MDNDTRSADRELDRAFQARAERQLRALYREVFSTPAGKKVLLSILTDMHFLSETTDPAAVALRNYATFLVRDRIGFNDAESVMHLIGLMLAEGK